MSQYTAVILTWARDRSGRFWCSLCTWILVYILIRKVIFPVDQPQIMAYKKLNNQGQYLPFHGYSAISMCDPAQPVHDAEAFIKSSKLSQYFSPLPSSSYHMTVFNIWSIRRQPIPPLQRWLDENNIQNPSNDFLPKDAMFTEFSQAAALANELFTSPIMARATLAPMETYGALTLIMEVEDDSKIRLFQQKCTDIFKHPDPQTMPFHVSLGYRYRRLTEQDYGYIQDDHDRLATMLNGTTVQMSETGIFKFPSMCNFINIKSDVDLSLLSNNSSQNHEDMEIR